MDHTALTHCDPPPFIPPGTAAGQGLGCHHSNAVGLRQGMHTMTGADIRKARATLGKLWGLDRPLRAAELGRVLRLRGRDPGATVLDWESGARITGPVERAIEAWLAGHIPSDLTDAL